MNRRGFLGLLGATIAGASLDPEKLLWIPGQKLISIPQPRVKRYMRIPIQLKRGGCFGWCGNGSDLGRGSYDTQTYKIVEVPE